jgi:hypothetical protein
MVISVCLEFEEGDRADALYLLHFCNGVRVDLDANNPACLLPLSYFEGRYVTPAGDVIPQTFTTHTEAMLEDKPADVLAAIDTQTHAAPAQQDPPAIESGAAAA